MKRIFCVASLGFLAACAMGSTSTKVDHTTTLADGSQRTVSQNTSGFGVFSPSSGATMEEAGRADVSTAIAGQIDRTPAFYPYGWYYGGAGAMSGTTYPLVQASQPYGAYTASGMVLGDQLARVVTPAPPMQIQVLQSRAPSGGSRGGGGGGTGGDHSDGGSGRGNVTNDQSEVSGACVMDDIMADYKDIRTEIVRIMESSSIVPANLKAQIESAEEVLNDGETACVGNENALAAIQKLHDKLGVFRKRLNELTTGK